MNAMPKAVRHWALQRRLGHWRPAIVAGKLESPRPASSYRGARRNAKFGRFSYTGLLAAAKEALELARAA